MHFEIELMRTDKLEEFESAIRIFNILHAFLNDAGNRC